MKFTRFVLLLILSGVSFIPAAEAIQRFPKPEFESGYLQPETLLSLPRATLLELVDLIVLAGALALVSWLVLKKRSRFLVFAASMASLTYFGFYRQGCVCSVGSIQNVSLALFENGYAIPLTVIGFFILPLLFTLFFGRTFCAGVCPFGALQDLVSFRPMEIGTRWNTILGLVPFIYLALSVLFAATGTDFIICRYDPFVGIFRFNASFGMFVFAGLLLLSGVLIARPYCRFLCPYGVLLSWISRFSWKHLTITPSRCIQCRLCETSCPYDAIRIPSATKIPETRQSMRRKLILSILLVPFFTGLGGLTLSLLHEHLAGVNPKVRLAATLLEPQTTAGKVESFEAQAFKASGKPMGEALAEAREVISRFHTGSWIAGAFLGLVFGLTLAGRLIHRHYPDYVPHKGNCFSCARCTDYCPVDRSTGPLQPKP